jgi:hypothetical protein
MVKPVKIALLPPEAHSRDKGLEDIHQLYILIQKRAQLTSIVSNNEVDFGSKIHFQILMTHEIDQFH